LNGLLNILLMSKMVELQIIMNGVSISLTRKAVVDINPQQMYAGMPL